MMHIFGKLQNKLEHSENIGTDKNEGTLLFTRYHQPNDNISLQVWIQTKLFQVKVLAS